MLEWFQRVMILGFCGKQKVFQLELWPANNRPCKKFYKTILFYIDSYWVHYSFIKPGQSITAETYCNQLVNMMQNLSEKRNFRNLDNFLQGKVFNSQQAIKNAFHSFIGSPSPGFYAKGINESPLRWQKCIDVTESYFE